MWTKLALAEGLIGAAGDGLLSIGASAVGSPEMTTAAVVLKLGSFIAEAGQASIMYWRLNMDPGRFGNNHSPSLPLATI